MAAHAALLGERPLSALLLGVTPDVANLSWPSRSNLLAVDSSAPMVNGVWPGDVPEVRWGVCGSWLEPPCRDSSLDIVTGDGSINCLRYPETSRALAASIHRALRRDGVLILRVYAQPEPKEEPEQVFEDALSRRIPTFTQFKFRLLMAAQASTAEGICVDEVYQLWVRHMARYTDVADRTGWHQAEIDSIGLYSGASTVHTFPKLAESRSLLAEFFDEVTVSIPSYYLGERCPTLVLRPLVLD